ncbi:MAG: riboflavin synthase [Acidimicrobiia bacterium]|nr:MAG: riboflavin synthase [Acidimicrobiia bacterium]
MFTGIVSELGTIVSTAPLDGAISLRVSAPETVGDTRIGDSIAVNGVCLTAVTIDESTFTVEVVEESLRRSSLGDLREGDVVNLERPMSVGGRFDGHIVQGHVDGVGQLSTIEREGDVARYRILVPSDLSRYMVEKGSIAVDGTSLTVSAVSDIGVDAPWFEVVLIPHTLEVTILGRLGVGSRVNIEVDVFAKYVERMVGSSK